MQKKPRITLFHCGFIYTGGGERIVIEEVLGLRKLGYEVSCFAPTLDKQACFPDVIGQVNVKTFLPQLPAWFPLRHATIILLSCLLAPWFVFRFLRTDIFIGANQPGAYFAWVFAKLLRKPYVVYLNQPNRILYPRDGENWQLVYDYYFLNLVLQYFRRPLSYLDRQSVTQAKRILTNGQFIGEEIARVYGLAEWIDCPAGVAKPQELLTGFSQKRGRFRGRIRVNGHYARQPYVLLTSRHVPWKRFDWAIRVMAKVVEQVPEVSLIFPGAHTDETRRLQRLAVELGLEDRVFFPGDISQASLWRLYQGAAVFCFPSPQEDLGIVVLEAQAFGVPVVAFNHGGPTVTVKSGETGFLVKPYDLDLMAKRLIDILSNRSLHRRLSLAAYRDVQENFSWDKHLAILTESLEEASHV